MTIVDLYLQAIRRQRWVQDWGVRGKFIRALAVRLENFAQKEWGPVEDPAHGFPRQLGRNSQQLRNLIQDFERLRDAVYEARRTIDSIIDHQDLVFGLPMGPRRAEELIEYLDSLALGCRYAVRSSGKGQRGAPSKKHQIDLIHDLAHIARDPLTSRLRRRGTTLTSRELAQVVSELLVLVKLRTGCKRVQNILSRPRNSADFDVSRDRRLKHCE